MGRTNAYETKPVTKAQVTAVINFDGMSSLRSIHSVCSFFQLCRRGIDESALAIEDIRDAHDFGIGLGPTFFFDRLANAGKGLDAVAGINTGGINHVFVPGAPQQPFRSREAAFAFLQLLI